MSLRLELRILLKCMLTRIPAKCRKEIETPKDEANEAKHEGKKNKKDKEDDDEKDEKK